MLFRIDGNGGVESVPTHAFADLGLRERDDLQEWVIEEPRILGEELLVATSEYAGFEDTLDRLDVLALDRGGKFVVVELKRDLADSETELQALKYASFCSTLTAEDVHSCTGSFTRRDAATTSRPRASANGSPPSWPAKTPFRSTRAGGPTSSSTTDHA